ncbi:MAG: cadherin-like domain-containing protein, partial [Acidobacteria bacterium]|nr:cadherin-like domain-containing protein [Acidobacteriota bacterium]
MKRLFPTFTLRHLTVPAICLMTLIALGWPLANAWKSFGQTRDESVVRLKAERPDAGAAEQPKTDILDKLLNDEPTETRAGVKTILASPMQETVNLLAPTITATMTDSIFTDVDGDGRADPGDTLQYTVTINNGGSDATGVKFTDTLPSSLTLVGGSVNTSPIAIDDTGYSATGNVRITFAAAGGLLANDIDPDTASNAGLTASGPATTTQGGNLTVNTNGSFVYNPAPGFTGTDTFTYTVTDAGGATATATATISVSNTIWFINNSGANGDGRLTSPFSSIANYNASSPTKDPNDVIFIYTGSGAYTGNLTLANGMKLIGQGVDLATGSGITPPTGSDPLPTAGSNPDIDSTSGNTVTLASGNTIRGLNLRDSAGIDLTGTSFGTLTVSAVGLTGT